MVVLSHLKPHQETPTIVALNLGAGGKRLSMLVNTCPGLQEKVERGHISPNGEAPLKTHVSRPSWVPANQKEASKEVCGIIS